LLEGSGKTPVLAFPTTYCEWLQGFYDPLGSLYTLTLTLVSRFAFEHP
jgi:hypothetical protein